MWVLARPMPGLAETMSHYLLDLGPAGGSDAPEADPAAQAILYVAEGNVALTVDGETHGLAREGYAYLPAGTAWSIRSSGGALVHWYRKRWVPTAGAAVPRAFVTSAADIVPTAMPGTDAWATTRFVDPADTDHDMHVNIVTFGPGGSIPFEETHVMEHSIHVLEGKAAYRLNRDWVEMEAG